MDTETLLRNRPLDVWMHEQDVRRAVGRPGNLDGPAGIHSADYLAESLGFVLVKRAQAPAGSSACSRSSTTRPTRSRSTRTVAVNGSRSRPVEPTTRIAMNRATFIELAGGRRPVDDSAIRIDGDPDLGRRIVDGLAVTP